MGDGGAIDTETAGPDAAAWPLGTTAGGAGGAGGTPRGAGGAVRGGGGPVGDGSTCETE